MTSLAVDIYCRIQQIRFKNRLPIPAAILIRQFVLWGKLSVENLWIFCTVQFERLMGAGRRTPGS
jgi:hypothetical protein